VGRAIRTKRCKYSVRAPEGRGYLDPDSDVYVEHFMYDLEKDPDGRNNLIRDPAYAELAATLVRRMIAVGEREPVIRSTN